MRKRLPDSGAGGAANGGWASSGPHCEAANVAAARFCSRGPASGKASSSNGEASECVADSHAATTSPGRGPTAGSQSAR